MALPTLCSPSLLFSGVRLSFPAAKRPGNEGCDFHLVPKLRMSDEIDVPELRIYSAWHGQGKTLPITLRLPSLRRLQKLPYH
jgi:hypothetical protein